MSVLVKITAAVPSAQMHKKAAAAFERLRKEVHAGSGVDFLARCGDVFRAANFKSTKDGVADRSWHKTGRAFDYDQESKALLIQSDIIAGKQYFRTYLICADQTGKQGSKLTVKDIRGYSKTCFVFDFTEAAAKLGFTRIAAWSGWQNNYNRREFWHYEFTEGLTWEAAMAQINGSAPASVNQAKKVLGLNDRGDEVREVQTKLHCKGFLVFKEIDGIFGNKTRDAVIRFQRSVNIAADGLVGNDTRKHLGM